MNDVKYKGLVVTLTREILDGKFVPLGAFPSERVLVARFGVSRLTRGMGLELRFGDASSLDARSCARSALRLADRLGFLEARWNPCLGLCRIS